jgi:hypothetical protein
MKTIIDCWNPANITKEGKNGFRYLDVTSIIKRTTEIEYSDNIDLFEKFYKMNNRLKYCNGSHFTFQDKSIEAEYYLWLQSNDYKKKSFSLYYGNSTVD